MNKKFWTVRAAAEPGVGELLLYGDISNESWWGDEVTPKQFKEDLDALGAVSQLNIYINSGGGDVFAGQAIYSQLKRHAAHKTVYVDGLAASIASVIAMAGDEVIMPSNAMMMVHEAWTIVCGNKTDLRKCADDMEKIDGSIVTVYVQKTGMAEDDVRAIMAAETWYSAEEAVAAGFADRVEDAKQIAASLRGDRLHINGQLFDPTRWAHTPDTLKNLPAEEDPASEPEDNRAVPPEPVPIDDAALLAQAKRDYDIRKKLLEV